MNGDNDVMKANKIIVPLSPPDISEEEINEVSDALRSGWITTGPRTKQLRRKRNEWRTIY